MEWESVDRIYSRLVYTDFAAQSCIPILNRIFFDSKWNNFWDVSVRQSFIFVEIPVMDWQTYINWY